MSTEKRRKYTDEFKAEAVMLVVEEGYSIAEAARNLGVNANMLGRWKRKLAASEGASPAVADRDVELRRLREENRRLKMEREILVKAAAFFANESGSGIDSSGSR